MRTLTTADAQAFASPYRRYTARVFIQDVNGTYQNMQQFQGYDWIESVDYDEATDQPVAACTINLFRSVYHLSLSPFMGASKLNNGGAMLAPFRRVYVETQTMVIDGPDATTPWVRVFDGYIDSVDPSGETIVIECRDLGSRLVDTFIEKERNYGSSTGRALHLVLQDIINDNYNTPALGPTITLYAPNPPTFLVYTHPLPKGPLMEALTALTDQIGYALRYKWDSTTSAFRLTLYDIGRDKVTPDYTFGPDDYYSISQLKLALEDIRNVVAVFFDDRANKVRASVEVSDSASVTANGRRYCALSESSSSQIDTYAEATTFANAVLKDLARPSAEQSVAMDYFYPAELGDYYAFSSNNKLYDSTQYFAAVNIKHSIPSDGKARTTIVGRGKPATAYRRWLRIEGRPGVAPGSGFTDPATPTGVLAYSTLSAVVIEYVPPDRDNWERTDVFLSTSGIADPGLDTTQPDVTRRKYLPVASTYLAASGKLTRFVISGLPLETLYYGRIQVMDLNGNLSAVSAQFTVTPHKNNPAYGNTNTTADPGILLNPDFNIYTEGLTAPPDNWKCQIGTQWLAAPGPGGIAATTAAASGNYAIYMQTTNTPGVFPKSAVVIQSDRVPFAGRDIISAGMYAKYTVANLSEFNYDTVYLNFWDAAGNPVGTEGYYTSLQTQAAVGTAYSLAFQFAAQAPDAARFVSASIIMNSNSGTALLVDRIGVKRGEPRLAAEVRRVVGEQGYDNSDELKFSQDTDYTLDTRSVIHNLNAGFTYNQTNREWTANIGGAFTFRAGCSFTHTNFDPENNWMTMSIERFSNMDNSNDWDVIAKMSGLTNDEGDVDMAISSPTIVVYTGDVFRLRIRSTEDCIYDTGLNTPGGKPSHFTADCIDRGDV
jgi:hypothetical protein